MSQICSLFGGRIAEEMTLGKAGVTTGASNDIQRATQIARNMVTKWGCPRSWVLFSTMTKKAKCSWAKTTAVVADA